MTRDDVQKALKEANLQFVMLSHRLEGMRTLHLSAALVQDAQSEAEYRQQMHSILDAQLDATIGTMTLTRKLMEFPS